MSNQQLPGKKLKKPKRPMTAYNFFFQSEHQKIRQESEGYMPEDEGGDKKEEVTSSIANDSTATSTKKRKTSRVGFEDLGKLIGKRWKEIGKDELERYQELARKDSERYKRESEKYYEDQSKIFFLGHDACLLFCFTSHCLLIMYQRTMIPILFFTMNCSQRPLHGIQQALG